MLIVLDTNVLVSGMMKKISMPGKVVDLILERRINVALDERILAEYNEVTIRPKLHIPSFIQKPTLAFIVAHAVYIQPQLLNPPPTHIPDLKDLPFAEVAVAAKADALVTGNMKHFAFLKEFNMRVLSPAQFAEWAEK